MRRAEKPAEIEPGLESQRRQLLIQAAMACVAEVGVDKTTVWMVAKRAGVSTGMVLYYFRNKKDLLNAAVDWAIRQFGERLEAVTQGIYGPERLKESMKIFLSDPLGAIPPKFLIQYRMAALNDGEIRQRSLVGFHQGRASLAKAVRASKERGQLRADIPDYGLADLIYTLANGLAAEMATHPEVMSLDRALRIAQMSINAFSVSAPGNASGSSSASAGTSDSTANIVERLLMGDSKISDASARNLAEAFRNLYEIAVREGAAAEQ